MQVYRVRDYVRAKNWSFTVDVCILTVPKKVMVFVKPTGI